MVKAEHNNAAFIQGRASADIIKSGGYKISALDIETALLELPFVLEAAVVGVNDITWGQVVATAIVPVQGRGGELTIEKLRDSLRDRLAPYKLPQRLKVVDVLPRNPMGKIQKKKVVEECFPQPREAKL